eukprot:scaffold28052_cov55-Phaeocystis_antarctica.AAC.3
MLLWHFAVPLSRLERQQQPVHPRPLGLHRIPHHPCRVQRRHPLLLERAALVRHPLPTQPPSQL